MKPYSEIMRPKAYILSLVFAGLLLASCNTTGCLNNGSALPLVGFYAAENGQPVAINTLDISGVGAPDDTYILSAGTSASQVFLPMRSLYNTTEWRFHYVQEGLDDDAFNDYIAFDYVSEPYFASEECGAMYYYLIKEVRYTTNIIERIEITDSLITNVDAERIKIYFRTQPETGPQADTE